MLKSGIWLRIAGALQFLRKYALLMFFAWRHPHTPRYIKTLLVIAAGYLISPVDVIPDTIPIVGLVDDMTLVPALLFMLSNLLPPSIRQDCQRDAARWQSRMPYIMAALAALGALWTCALIYGLWALFH